MLARILGNFYRHVAELSWPMLAAMVAGHAVVGWTMMVAAGEPTLSHFGHYIWWHSVTSTTVGYGDSFPATTAGRFVTVLWVMTGGIALFTATIGKTVAAVARVARARMDGLGDYGNMRDHLVVLGWQPSATHRAIELFLSDSRYNHDGIVLVDAVVERNPVPASTHFVKAQTLTSPDGFKRSGMMRSEVVVVFGRDDAETLTVALAAWAACEASRTTGPLPRVVASFTDTAVADILRAHCPGAEVAVSLAVETMVRAAQDPGSSEVQRQLLSPEDSPTQYSLEAPDEASGITFTAAMAAFKDRLDATLIGVRHLDGRVVVNPPGTLALQKGMMLYVVASERILVAQAISVFGALARGRSAATDHALASADPRTDEGTRNGH